MSEVIKFDTEELTSTTATQRPYTFDLVHETDPILREVMPEWDFKNPPTNANEFASTMVETCKHYRGYGLSANQCGFKYRMFVMGSGEEYVAFFNPSIVLETHEKTHMVEGCLSFPLLALNITRSKEIAVTYQDFNGEWKNAQYDGMSARIFLHELDHLNGIVYTSRVKPMALQSGMKKRGKITNLIQKAEKNLSKLEAFKK